MFYLCTRLEQKLRYVTLFLYILQLQWLVALNQQYIFRLIPKRHINIQSLVKGRNGLTFFIYTFIKLTIENVI